MSINLVPMCLGQASSGYNGSPININFLWLFWFIMFIKYWLGIFDVEGAAKIEVSAMNESAAPISNAHFMLLHKT